MLRGLFFPKFSLPDSPHPPHAAPMSHRLRERLHRGTLKGLGGVVFYGLVIEPRWIETTVLEFPVPGLPKALEGYRIVHLTDLHHNAVTGRGYLERALLRANVLQPDLVVLTGDYITHRAARMEAVARLMRRLQAPDGVFATLGNHDYRAPVEQTRRAFARAGVHLLENAHTMIYPRRLLGNGAGKPGAKTGAKSGAPRGKRPPSAAPPPPAESSADIERRRRRRNALNAAPPCICLVGIGDLWEGKADLRAALESAPGGVVRLLLSHNPAAAHLLSPRDAIHLVLSGHTHGGQAWPFHRPPVKGDAARRYLRGLARSPAAPVYVSRGLGASAFHFRWNCRPEIVLVRLWRAQKGLDAPRTWTLPG